MKLMLENFVVSTTPLSGSKGGISLTCTYAFNIHKTYNRIWTVHVIQLSWLFAGFSVNCVIIT